MRKRVAGACLVSAMVLAGCGKTAPVSQDQVEKLVSAAGTDQAISLTIIKADRSSVRASFWKSNTVNEVSITKGGDPSIRSLDAKTEYSKPGPISELHFDTLSAAVEAASCDKDRWGQAERTYGGAVIQTVACGQFGDSTKVQSLTVDAKTPVTIAPADVTTTAGITTVLSEAPGYIGTQARKILVARKGLAGNPAITYTSGTFPLDGATCDYSVMRSLAFTSSEVMVGGSTDCDPNPAGPNFPLAQLTPAGVLKALTAAAKQAGVAVSDINYYTIEKDPTHGIIVTINSAGGEAKATLDGKIIP